MCCPYFDPSERFDRISWVNPPRMPLGDPYRGVCLAGPGGPAPDTDTLRELCNFGYARGRCGSFTMDDAPDAVRFSIVEDADGTIELHYILEKHHAPHQHGRMRFAPDGVLCGTSDGGLLGRQARAYIGSYLRRKTDPRNGARNSHGR